MTTQPLRLKALLRERHLQTYGSFRREYEKAAHAIDAALVTSAPSRAQFARWLSGGLKGLPYSDHCAVLERMLPGWTAKQLFEPCPAEAITPHGSEPPSAGPADGGGLLRLIGDRLDQPESADREWGQRARSTPARTGAALAAALAAPDAGEVSDDARQLGRGLLELSKARDLGEDETRQLAELAGCTVELARTLELDIGGDGDVHLVYHFDLLNLNSKPLTRVTRDLWFEYTSGPLRIAPAPDSERRLVIQRIHDTSNLAKFAFQISPPLRPGEHARVGYSCDGGRFADHHYWREEMAHYTRHYALRVRQENVRLGGCTATEEYPDGAENSAADGMTWDEDSGGITLTLARDYLRPKQTATLRWEIVRGAAG